MRIGILTRHDRIVGGAETYLARVVPQLAARGHELAFVHEVECPGVHEPILPPHVALPAWSVQDSGWDGVLHRLRAWNPDVVLLQGVADSAGTQRIVASLPTVFRAENYYGTCISGSKMTAWPRRKPCSRNFGPACLAYYFPRRCGGLNPITMMRLYRQQRRKLDLLRQFRAVVTLSEFLRLEFIRHGIPADRVYCLPFPTPEGMEPYEERPPRGEGQPFRLLFLGRMDRLKGGDLLLEALPIVRKELGQAIHLDLAGEGPERGRWQKLAGRVTSACHGVSVQFHGWIGTEARTSLLKQADLLVVPSVWPEPFGHVGLEAAQWGVPAAAFAVGGIPEWLQHGVTGRLAPADPATPRGLAEAIVACLGEEAKLAAMRRNAWEFARRSTLAAHVQALENVLGRVVE